MIQYCNCFLNDMNSQSVLSNHYWLFLEICFLLSSYEPSEKLEGVHAGKEYAQTKNILHVKELLGHRNINSTLVYTHLVPFDDDAEGYNHATTSKETTSAG
jgi:hypothetical protein